MSREAVIRNYADTLLELASREGAVVEYGEWLGELAGLYEGERKLQLFLDTPRVTTEEKQRLIRTVLGDEAPGPLVRFLQVLVGNRRHRILPRVSEAYRELVDERKGRVRAVVTLATEPEGEFRAELERQLNRAFRKDVTVQFRTDESIVGGVVVRVGDRLLDGSLRRRLRDLKRRMMDSARVEDGGAPRGKDRTRR